MAPTIIRSLFALLLLTAVNGLTYCEAWWKAPQGPAYQVLVYSFADSDGDGYGDLRGLTAKLDYLNDSSNGQAPGSESLGVEAIWLSPIAPSPSYHGYDVTDYKAIEPKLGTMADFEKLLAEAHKRKIKVILDLVFNHSSKQHPWFKSWVEDPQGPHANFYVERKNGSNYGSGGMGRFYPSGNGREYFAVFWDGMPDLNLSNPRVIDELKSVMAFWIAKGVDGFRFDAVKHSFDINEMPSGTGTLALNKNLWRDLITYGRSLKADLFTVGEVLSENLAETSSWNGVFDSLFDFPTARAILNVSSAMGAGNLVEGWIRGQKQYERNGPWHPSLLLSNHDQDRVISVILPRTGDDRVEAISRAKMLSALLFTLPGLPWIYYGEELGLEGRRWANDDINRRLPIPWTENPKGDGFAWWAYHTGKTELAINSKVPSVRVQSTQGDSILNHYRQLSSLRQAFPALRAGNVSLTQGALGAQGGDLLSWTLTSPEQTVLVVHNLGIQPVELTLPLNPPYKKIWVSSPFDGEDLPPRSSLVVELSGAKP